MNTINLSISEFMDLEKMNLHKEIVNTECDIYFLPPQDNTTPLLFKRFKEISEAEFQNKFKRLEQVDGVKQAYPISGLVYPTSLVAVDDRLCGYAMPYIEGPNLKKILFNPYIPYQRKIEYLKQIGIILDQMHNTRKYTTFHDFYLYDIHESNFQLEKSTGKIKAIDIDSVGISNIPIEKSMYLNPLLKFERYPGKYPTTLNSENNCRIAASEQTEIYCYIMMILNFIAQENISLLPTEDLLDYMNYLETIGYPFEIIEIFAKVYSEKANENPYELLEKLHYIKKSSYKSYKRALRL